MSTIDAYKAELAALLEVFGANVRRIRGSQRPYTSQERLAHATRLHRTEIGRIEQASVEPRLTTLVILADGLGVGVEDLLDGVWVPHERRPASNNQWP
jgi:transcriptional regulator with XRE-family HTH domain